MFTQYDDKTSSANLYRKRCNFYTCVKHSKLSFHNPYRNVIYLYIYIYIYIYIYCGGRSKRQTQWAWRQASERLLLNRKNKIVSKGDEVSKINGGSGVLVVLRDLWRRGSVREGRVQVRGRSPAAARAPLSGPGREVRRLPLAASSSFWPAALPGVYGPASWPVSRLAGAELVARRSLLGPTRTPACMHGEETGLPRRGALGI